MEDNKYRIETKIGEKMYQMICDHDSPITDAKEAIFQFIKHLGKIEDNAIVLQQEKLSQQISEEKA